MRKNLNHYKIIYTTNALGEEVPLSKAPVFNTFADTDEQAVKDLFDCIPDVLSGYISLKTFVTKETI